MKKRDTMHYVWNKIQEEVNNFWQDKSIVVDKLQINEDNRLPIMSYVII